MSIDGPGRLNQAKLDELRALESPNTAGFFARIVETYLADAGRQVERIRQGVSGGDAAAVAGAAHTLKGSSSYLGASRLADLCERLQQTAELQGLDGAGPLVEEVTDEVAATSASLRRELG